VNHAPDPVAPDLVPVLETALDAVVVMRDDGVIVGWNAVAERIFGWSRAEAIGAQLSSLIIPHEFRHSHRLGLKKYLETGEGPVLNRHIEITALRADGEIIPVELSITPTWASGGRVFLGFLRDITERKLTEATIKRRATEAEAIAKLTALAAESSSIDLVMQRCLEAVCDITTWKLAHAFRCPEEDPDLLIDTGIWHAPPEARIDPLVEATARMKFRSKVGLPGISHDRKQPIWWPQVKDEFEFPRAQAAAEVGLQSALAFPILSGPRVLAVLEFFHDSPAEPDPALLPTLQTLGEQVGRVFERTRADDRLREEREALLAEIKRREELEGSQQLLLKELNHRVKNTLAVVAGLAQQTGKSSSNIPEFIDKFSGRLAALATAHTLLTTQRWHPAPLHDLINELLRPFSAGSEDRLHADGPEVMLEPRCMFAISFIIHELLTNALKYGALANSGGNVLIAWERVDEGQVRRLRLRWREEGLEGIREPQHSGFGSKLLQASVRHELKGTLDARWHDDGLELQIEFPLKSR
jgi:PAS domain S-box-containing protein